jgi:hypothetical protein
MGKMLLLGEASTLQGDTAKIVMDFPGIEKLCSDPLLALPKLFPSLTPPLALC